MAKVQGTFIRPPGSGIWWISYYDADRKRHREKVGFNQRRAAIEAVRRRRQEVKEGRFFPPRKGANLTFRELAEAAMVQKKLRLAPGSYAMDRSRLDKLYPLIGDVPADRLHAPRIDDTLAQLKRRPLSNSTVNRYRAVMSSVYAIGVRDGLVPTNPVSKVKGYKENDPRRRWLRPDEEDRLRKCLKVDYHRWELDLALNTGMRRGEQWGLRWKDCDVERGNLTVVGKTGRRPVRANKAARSALKKLQRYSGNQEWAIPDNDGTARRDWRTWFEDAAEEANILDFHWHDLRHTFASRLVMAGVDIPTVSKLLGHRNITQTMKYSHLSPGHMHDAVEKLDGTVLS